MQPRGTQLEIGSVIAGYRVDELIGRGGMGVVYRATNVALNRSYALKVLAPELAGDEQFRERFKREIRIAASLDHPNVVGIHYAGEHDGVLFLAMDLIDGTDLGDVIRRTGPLAPERAVGLLLQITSALDAAHREGLVHRDVKPANVLISVEDGREHAYLTDFGLAKRFDAATALTMKGLVVGTVDYMPPEQIAGSHTDARTDIYALGCVFFQMLTGTVPYERPNSVATLFAHAYEPPPRLEGPVSDLHPTLGRVIAKAMAKDPGERYLSAGDFARDAAAALQGTRYTGTPTVVATGEAKTLPDEHETQGAGAALIALEAAMQQPIAAAVSETRMPEAAAPTTSPAGPETVASPSTASPPQNEDWVGTTPTPRAPATAETPVASPAAAGDAPPHAGGSVRKYRWPIAAALALAAAVIAIVALGSSPSSTTLAGLKGASEVVAAPVSTPGANPFTPKAGTDVRGVMPPAAAASSSGGPVSYSGSLPGLYGGTRNYSSCDAAKLVNFLEQNPAKAAAWASTLGIQTTQIRNYVSGLTDVILRTDTRVTNHGYVNGVADPIQSVLEAGTAVLVDRYGRPVVKCYCGNPLTAPVLYSAPVYTGPLWTGFSTTRITIIVQSTTIINQYVLFDPATGQEFTRTLGVHGHDGPYATPGTSTTTQPQPTTPTSPSSTPTQPPTSAAAPTENPSVSLSPNPVTQGDTVSLSASGFAPGASLQITVNRPDGVVEHYPLSAGADGAGTYTFSNAAGNAPLGTYNVTVANLATGASASASIDVQAPPASTTGTDTTTT
jgi:hypothetical protein